MYFFPAIRIPDSADSALTGIILRSRINREAFPGRPGRLKMFFVPNRTIMQPCRQNCHQVIFFSNGHGTTSPGPPSPLL